MLEVFEVVGRSVHQHGATVPRDTGARSNYKKFGDEPADYAIGRTRGGLTTKSHLVAVTPTVLQREASESRLSMP